MNILLKHDNPGNLDGLKSRAAVIAKRKYNLSLLTLCIPGLICLILFKYLPMFGIVVAFKNYVPIKGIFGSDWCGFNNFKFFFSSQDAGRTIRNTVLYGVEFLILDLFFGVLIAILLYNLKSRSGTKTYHTIILLPRFMSAVIVSFMAYAILSPPYGVANQIIEMFGGEPIQWYSEAKYWPFILSFAHVWKTIGSGCLYYYAGLMGIDPGLFEAAELDGASSFRKMWHVAIPQLIPIMCIKTILGIGHVFSGDIGLFYQLPMNQGLLYETTDIINTYTYRSLLGGSLARSAAVGLFQSLVGLVLVLCANAIINKVSPENAMF